MSIVTELAQYPFPRRLPEGWRALELGDCCRSVADGDWIETKDQGGTDYRLLQVSNIAVGTFRETGKFRYITQETFDRLRCREVAPGNVLVARMPDPVGRAWHVRELVEPAITAVDVAIVETEREVLDPEYLAYYLNSPFNLAQAAMRASGTTRARITRRDLERFPVPVPPIAVQKRIGSVLGSFDRLADDNRRRIGILDEISRLIYREWFVDFRFPGHATIECVDSELGPIPRGWEVARLGDIASLTDGDWIETKDQGGSDFRLLQVSNIGLGSFRETGNFRYVTAETFRRLNCTAIDLGDILVSRMPDPVGRAWYVDYMSEPAITAVDVAIVRPHEKFDGRLLELFLNSPRTIAFSEQVATGTTRKRVTRRVLADYRLALPAADLRQQFDELTRPMSELKQNLAQQNLRLRRARDLLLPRLVTGQLDVSSLDVDLEPIG